jgi:hypothetical protein
VRDTGGKSTWKGWSRAFAYAILCASSVFCALGCARLRPFRVALSEPQPTPAALSENSDPSPAPGLPLGLASEGDYVVRVVAGQITCSGTLIDTDQVLTAHHCVSERNNSGDPVAREVPLARIRIELGGDYLPWGELGVRSIVAPSCGHRGGEGDLAILVLERKLVGVPTAKPRLDAPPALGEAVEPIGFGRCALTGDGIRRNSRSAGSVDRMGPDRFRLQAAICPGDSGGPGLSSKNGEIIGVISESVMDGSEQTRGLSEFTRLDRWRSLFSNAKLVAGGTNQAELPPVECADPTPRPKSKPRE